MKIGKNVGITIVALVAVIVVGFSDEDPVGELREFEGSVSEILALVDNGDTNDALALLDRLHNAVVGARARLNGYHFRGQSNALTDPFVLPAGVYRVHFTTEGFGVVQTVVLDGPDSDDTLFNVFQGAASGGASAVYRSQGTRLMIQISNISAPYELVFERME